MNYRIKSTPIHDLSKVLVKIKWHMLLLLLLQCIGMNALAKGSVESKAIKTILASQQTDKRTNAVKILKNKNSLAATEALAHALVNDPSSWVRSAAAGGLWEHSHASEVESAMRHALHDDPAVAVRAADALQASGTSALSLADAYRKGLLASDYISQYIAARALIGIDHEPDLLPIIIKYLHKQALKNSQSGIKSASDALQKLYTGTLRLKI